MKSKKTKRMAPLERKKEIVVAAVGLIAQSGVHNVTFARIAAVAKVKQPLVNYYFPTFDSLLVDCVMLVLEDLKSHMIAEIEKNPDPLKSLMAFTLSPLDWLIEKKDLQPLWHYFYHLTATSDRFRLLNDEIRRTGRERISFLIFRVLEKTKSQLPHPWTAESLAWTLQTMATGYATMATTENADVKSLRRIFTQHLELILKPMFDKNLGTR